MFILRRWPLCVIVAIFDLRISLHTYVPRRCESQACRLVTLMGDHGGFGPMTHDDAILRGAGWVTLIGPGSGSDRQEGT